ncbi:Alpha/Beta hydrolase protein [Aspergillus keveii]|uniref:Alpha/Beta hydrolase protein n=1 Tax=Aspergillus keveii TaxID=714993 RepID=A0ABR4G1U7_9EURO
MNLSALTLLLAGLAPYTHARPSQNLRGGSGPYPAMYTTDPTLANHTLYHPQAPYPHLPLPVLIWGNGSCMNNGTAFATFLTELASHGYLVIAPGPPDGTGITNSQLMHDAISWVTGRPGRSPFGPYRTIDANRIAVAGQSCGGLEAYQMCDEERVKGLGIFNSGFTEGGVGGSAPGFPNQMKVPSVISEVHKPVFWFLGGEEDVAYPNGMRDYAALTGQPKWVGNYPVGHMGTYAEPNGGAFGVAAVKWLDFLLRGDQTAKGFFADGGTEQAGWEETASEGLMRFEGLLKRELRLS